MNNQIQMWHWHPAVAFYLSIIKLGLITHFGLNAFYPVNKYVLSPFYKILTNIASFA